MRKMMVAAALVLTVFVYGCGGGGGGGTAAPAAGDNPPVSSGGTTTTTTTTGGGNQNPTLAHLTVSEEAVTIVKSITKQLSVTGTYSDGTTRNMTSVVWSTSNGNVATVSSAGLVTAVGAGTCTITATSGSISDSTSVTVTEPGFRMPDTNQAQSYTSTFGEDHDYSINTMSYTDNGDGTVKDNVTGLTWQKENFMFGETWDEGRFACVDLVLGGHNDWRLPSRLELVSIVDKDAGGGVGGFAIDSAFAVVIRGTETKFWTSILYGDLGVWCVDFRTGHPERCNNPGSGLTRCVRGAPAVENPVLTDNGNGTVTDTKTRLVWQQGENAKMNWEQALAFCENLSLAGSSDWRLPNYKELQSLVHVEYNVQPTIDVDMFPSSDNWGYFWSSTTENSWHSPALIISFYSGRTGNIDAENKLDYQHVRCVRGGQ